MSYYTSIIQSCIDGMYQEGNTSPRYLEIGLGNCRNFNEIKAPAKFGCDLSRESCVRVKLPDNFHQMVQVFEMTSNELFNRIQLNLLDVVFIDGLHTYEQVYVDLQNSLEAIRTGGWVLLHDTFPKTESQQVSATSVEDAMQKQAELGLPVTREWCGDVYKIKRDLVGSHGLKVIHHRQEYGLTMVKKLTDQYEL